MARDARSNTIGAYYQLHENIVDMHATMNEAGVIYCSAKVHFGWQRAEVKNGIIKESDNMIGGHAFAIVGYDADGFLVQNSWGKIPRQEGLTFIKSTGSRSHSTSHDE